ARRPVWQSRRSCSYARRRSSSGSSGQVLGGNESAPFQAVLELDEPLPQAALAVVPQIPVGVPNTLDGLRRARLGIENWHGRDGDALGERHLGRGLDRECRPVGLPYHELPIRGVQV